MSTLTIIEGQGVGKGFGNEQQAMLLPFITIQRVTFTGTQGNSAALNSNTSLVRLYADAACSVLASTISSASVGSTTGILMVASSLEYFSVPAGGTIYFSVVAIG
jgi:hypothetical protein